MRQLRLAHFFIGGIVMKIKTELLKVYISDYINNNIEDFEIDVDETSNSVAVNMLSEIQKILKNDGYSDFEIVEKITDVFRKNNIDCGGCHDF